MEQSTDMDPILFARLSKEDQERVLEAERRKREAEEQERKKQETKQDDSDNDYYRFG